MQTASCTDTSRIILNARDGSRQSPISCTRSLPPCVEPVLPCWRRIASSEVGTDGARYRAALDATWFPALERFKPQLLVISAGFDAHREDDMAHLRLQDADFDWLTRRLMDVADMHANGRIVSTLEGGYAIPALARCAAGHTKRLMEG